MPEEVVAWLQGAKVIVDGTFGGGGHSTRFLAANQDSRVIGMDRDPSVSRRFESRNTDDRIDLFIGSYEQTGRALEISGIDGVDAMVLDLGLSSDQLEDRDRGFSFTVSGPLDLRFDPDSGTSAADWLMQHSESEIADAIYQYGEERYSRRIAREVVARRRGENPVTTVEAMVDVCRKCVPRSKNHNIHPATRTFQALRIQVNDELNVLSRTLDMAPQWLNPGGKMVVISFHSLEDRIVKNAFRNDSRWNVLTKKPLRPSDEEVAQNPRARSEKLRVAERSVVEE